MHDGSWWFFGMHTFWWLFWIAIIVLFFSPPTPVPKQSHIDATHHANRRGERYHAHVRLVFDRRRQRAASQTSTSALRGRRDLLQVWAGKREA